MKFLKLTITKKTLLKIIETKKVKTMRTINTSTLEKILRQQSKDCQRAIDIYNQIKEPSELEKATIYYYHGYEGACHDLLNIIIPKITIREENKNETI